MTSKPKESQEVKEVKKKTTAAIGIEVLESKKVSMSEMTAAIYNITKNGLGICALFIGSGLHSGGIVVGLSVLVIMCVSCGFTFYYVGICCGVTKTNSYKHVFEAAFGKKYGLIIPVCMFCVTYTIISIYMVAIGEFAIPLIFPGRDDPKSKAMCMLAIGLIVATPYAFVPSLDDFKYGSLLGLITLTYVALLHFVAAVTGHNLPKEANEYYMFPGAKDLVASFGFIAVMGQAFGCHYNASNFYNQVKQNTQVFSTVSKISFGLMLIIKGMIGLCAYINFGSEISEKNCPPSVLIFTLSPYKDNYPKMYYPAAFGCFLVSLNLAIGFGLTLYPTRVALNEFYQYLKSEKESGTEMSYQRRLTITSILCLVIIIQSTFSVYYDGFKILELLVNIATSVFCTPITFLFPTAMYHVICKPKEMKERVLCFLIFILGLLSGITGVMKIIFTK
jgi:hypothetical protein